MDKFLSTLSLRRATAGTVPEHCEGVFLSTLSLRRATCGKHRDRPHGRISIHALLAESDKFFYHPVHIPLLFLSTLSLRRATVRSSLTLSPSLFLSTLSLRRATYIPLVRYLLPGISIHALLAESDAAFFVCHHDSQYFYPRSPCGERPGSSRNAARWRAISIHALLAESDSTMPAMPCCTDLFLSTLSLRRATSRSRYSKSWQYYFYPRSPCGERQC